MSRIAFLAGEPVWPATHGGRMRMAGLVDQLVASGHEVLVLECAHRRHARGDGEERPGVRRVALPPSGQRVRAVLGTVPRLGASLLGAEAIETVVSTAEGADAIVVGQSYLAAALPELSVPVVVDFQNLEVERDRSLARLGPPHRRLLHLVEALKADRWEPRVARAARLVMATCEPDSRRLQAWGARRVVVVPNVVEGPSRTVPSPDDGYVLVIGNAAYPPNRDGIADLLRRSWPRVTELRPGAQLVVAGTGTDAHFRSDLSAGVTVHGWVEDLDALYAGAALVAAPVRWGGGTQLKVREALAHRRVVVATGQSARSAAGESQAGLQLAEDPGEMGRAIAGLLSDPSRRHTIEAELAEVSALGWSGAAAPMLAGLAELLLEGRAG